MDGLVAVSWWLLDGKHRCMVAGLRQWGHWYGKRRCVDMKGACIVGRLGLAAIDFFLTDKKQLTECWAGDVGNDVIQQDYTSRLKIWVVLAGRFNQIK